MIQNTSEMIKYLDGFKGIDKIFEMANLRLADELLEEIGVDKVEFTRLYAIVHMDVDIWFDNDIPLYDIDEDKDLICPVGDFRGIKIYRVVREFENNKRVDIRIRGHYTTWDCYFNALNDMKQATREEIL